MHRTVIQRAVVGVVADAVLVKGEKDIDGSCGCLFGILLCGSVEGCCEVWGEG